MIGLDDLFFELIIIRLLVSIQYLCESKWEREEKKKKKKKKKEKEFSKAQKNKTEGK